VEKENWQEVTLSQ